MMTTFYCHPPHPQIIDLPRRHWRHAHPPAATPFRNRLALWRIIMATLLALALTLLAAPGNILYEGLIRPPAALICLAGPTFRFILAALILELATGLAQAVAGGAL